MSECQQTLSSLVLSSQGSEQQVGLSHGGDSGELTVSLLPLAVQDTSLLRAATSSSVSPSREKRNSLANDNNYY